jgi:16S rRNA (cytidine1402-2'-O)-methyltransferase
MLHIVSTPIGNMEDVTHRALNVLKAADAILAEDTRRTGLLLSRYGIKNRLISYNDHNKEKRGRVAIELLKEGKDVALVSDSGTPGINDPAYNIVRDCIREGIPVSPVPGACAAISALVCSGLPTDRFSFHGFVPKKDKKRLDLFNEILPRKETKILYDSPHRIHDTVRILSENWPAEEIVIAREMTKVFEEFIRGPAADVDTKIKDKEIKGEIVLLLK